MDLSIDLSILPGPRAVTAMRLGALDGGDWNVLALAILAEPESRQLPRVVVADCFALAHCKEFDHVQQRKLLTLSDWIDDRRANV
jgi:hypothetical protein